MQPQRRIDTSLAEMAGDPGRGTLRIRHGHARNAQSIHRGGAQRRRIDLMHPDSRIPTRNPLVPRGKHQRTGRGAQSAIRHQCIEFFFQDQTPHFEGIVHRAAGRIQQHG
ncbi:hypothetical protein D3C87_1654470 [compost metagenome]